MTAQAHPKRLYFLRHGQTDWNARGLFQGRSDIPLNDHGRSQARDDAALVRGWFGGRGEAPRFALAAASPLKRAHETCRIVLDELSRVPGALVPAPGEIQLEEDLQEQCYGEWEGLSLAEIRRRFPGSVERQFASMRSFTADGGEPLDALKDRVNACVRRLPGDSLVVGHFGTLYAIMLDIWPGELKAFPEIPQHAFFIVEDGQVTRVDAAHPAGFAVEPERL